ncbi:MAG TPA: hypothetical protein VHD59_15160 [Pseudolabrys sp.]|jgi:hypothetical protein|nr:hypothetical protein [Pseudolabrys sp.]
MRSSTARSAAEFAGAEFFGVFFADFDFDFGIRITTIGGLLLAARRRTRKLIGRNRHENKAFIQGRIVAIEALPAIVRAKIGRRSRTKGTPAARRHERTNQCSLRLLSPRPPARCSAGAK